MTSTAQCTASLRTLLQATAKVASARGSNPAHSSVVLRRGVLIASDDEVRTELLSGLPDSVDVSVSHAKLLAIANSTDKELVIEASEDSCVVRCGSGKWSMRCREGLPDWPQEEGSSVCRLPVDQFLRAITSAQHSVDRRSHGGIGCVLLEVDDSSCHFVTTDGKRMSVASCEHDLAVDPSQSLLSPKAAATLSRVASLCRQDTSVQIDRSGSTLRFEYEVGHVLVRLSDGKFPNWRGLIPSRERQRVVVSRSGLLPAITSAAVVASETSRGITFLSKGDKLVLAGKSAEYGTSTVSMRVVEAGEHAPFVIDPSYVAQWLVNLPADEDPDVSIDAVDGSQAVVFRCGDCFVSVIMPIGGET